MQRLRPTAVPAQGVHGMRLSRTFLVPPTRILCPRRNLALSEKMASGKRQVLGASCCDVGYVLDARFVRDGPT
jgi:hypothetical protein